MTSDDDNSALLRKAKRYLEKHDKKKPKKKSRDDHFDDKKRSKRKKKDSKHYRKDEKKDSRKIKKRRRRHEDSEDSDNRRDKTKRIKKVDRSKLTDMGSRLEKPPATLLDSESDYFSHHKHLWVYLYREEGVAFSDISSTEKAHKAFARFCRKYNDGALESAYYQPVLPQDVLDECQTTKHKWSFNTSSVENDKLHLLQEGVRRQTDYQEVKEAPLSVDQDRKRRAGDDIHADDDSPPRRDWKAERVANRRLKDHVRVVEEELTGGRKEGREMQIEKRKERADKIHGASRDRDSMVEISDESLYGDGGRSSFQTALRREKSRSTKNVDRREARIAELRDKEKAKQEAMFRQLGITPGQKITIKERK